MTTTELKLALAHLPAGSTGSMKCPYCQAEHEHKFHFKITENQILGKCFRASCAVAVRINTNGPIKVDAPKKDSARPLYSSLSKCSPETKGVLDNLYGFDTDYGISADGRVAMPLRNHHGVQWGVLLRKLKQLPSPWEGPKAVSYYDKPSVSRLHYSMKPFNGCAVLVEDVPSADKLASVGVCGIALLGTHLSEDAALELSDIVSYVACCLDADATANAISMSERYGLWFRNFYVVPLSKDVKDMNSTELAELLQRLESHKGGAP